MSFRFLVVDDAAFLREIVKNQVCSAGGVCVGESANGEEAIEMALATFPDLIFMDLVMPQKNGIEAAKSIKAILPSIKIIGCSTIDLEPIIKKALSECLDSYVLKPFTSEQIVNAVHLALNTTEEAQHGRT